MDLSIPLSTFCDICIDDGKGEKSCWYGKEDSSSVLSPGVVPGVDPGVVKRKRPCEMVRLIYFLQAQDFLILTKEDSETASYIKLRLGYP